MKFIKKAAAAIVAASLTFSLCSCSNLSWAAKIGDDATVPIGLYIYGMAENYRTAVQNYELVTSQTLDEQTVTVSNSDKSAVEYLDNEGIKLVKSYVGAYLMAEELGIELTDDEIESAESSAATTYETDQEVFEQNGIAQSSIEEYYKDVARKSNIFQAKYGEEGSDPIPTDELKEYFNTNYASVNFIQQYFYNDDGSMMSDDEIEALTQQYKDIQSQAEKGEIKFTDKCKEFSENATSYKSGYTDSVSRFNSEDEDGAKILALKEGEFTLLVTDSAIALLQKAPLDSDGSRFEQYRSTLLIEYKYNDFLKELIDYAESADNVQFNDAAFEKFSSSTRDFSEISTSSYSY